MATDQSPLNERLRARSPLLETSSDSVEGFLRRGGVSREISEGREDVLETRPFSSTDVKAFARGMRDPWRAKDYYIRVRQPDKEKDRYGIHVYKKGSDPNKGPFFQGTAQEVSAWLNKFDFSSTSEGYSLRGGGPQSHIQKRGLKGRAKRLLGLAKKEGVSEKSSDDDDDDYPKGKCRGCGNLDNLYQGLCPDCSRNEYQKSKREESMGEAVEMEESRDPFKPRRLEKEKVVPLGRRRYRVFPELSHKGSYIVTMPKEKDTAMDAKHLLDKLLKERSAKSFSASALPRFQKMKLTYEKDGFDRSSFGGYQEEGGIKFAIEYEGKFLDESYEITTEPHRRARKESKEVVTEPGFVKTPEDEALWKKAKRAAKHADADNEYAFANFWFHKQKGKDTVSDSISLKTEGKVGNGTTTPASILHIEAKKKSLPIGIAAKAAILSLFESVGMDATGEQFIEEPEHRFKIALGLGHQVAKKLGKDKGAKATDALMRFVEEALEMGESMRIGDTVKIIAGKDKGMMAKITGTKKSTDSNKTLLVYRTNDGQTGAVLPTWVDADKPTLGEGSLEERAKYLLRCMK